MKPDTSFTISYREKDDKRFLIVAPKKSSIGYPPKQIEITEEQWNELLFHFIKVVDDKNDVTRLAYITD